MIDGPKRKRQIPGRLYTLLFDIWHWYAVHILRVPWIICYNPPPDGKILGMTYAWSKEYVERVQRGFQHEQIIQQLQAENEALRGTRRNRRVIHRAAQRAAERQVRK